MCKCQKAVNLCIMHVLKSVNQIGFFINKWSYIGLGE